MKISKVEIKVKLHLKQARLQEKLHGTRSSDSWNTPTTSVKENAWEEQKSEDETELQVDTNKTRRKLRDGFLKQPGIKEPSPVGVTRGHAFWVDVAFPWCSLVEVPQSEPFEFIALPLLVWYWLVKYLVAPSSSVLFHTPWALPG